MRKEEPSHRTNRAQPGPAPTPPRAHNRLCVFRRAVPMGSSGAYSFRRLTLAHLHDNPPLFATGRRKSSSTAQPRPSITSATIGVGDPFIPYYHYRKPPSRPPSRPPSKPPSNRNSAALSRHNTVRSHQFAFAYDGEFYMKNCISLIRTFN